MNHDTRNKPDSHQNAQDALLHLTSLPTAAFDRGLEHGKDRAYAMLSSVEDSQIAIAWAVREAMEKLELGIYRVHELTGLTCDYIEAVLEARADICDSEPIRKLELALQVQLNHL